MHTELLRTNAALNGVPLVVVPTALGADGVALFDPLPHGSFFNAGGVSMRRGDYPRMYDGTKVVIFRQPTSRPWDFVKIDVEGAEADVWRALDGVKAESPHLTVCMEFTPAQHEDPQAFLSGIAGEGFTIGTVGHDGFVRPCSIEEAVVPDTGDFRMLWLSKEEKEF